MLCYGGGSRQENERGAENSQAIPEKPGSPTRLGVCFLPKTVRLSSTKVYGAHIPDIHH